MSTSSPRYQPYPAYRDSGEAWLGEIPAHWEVSTVGRHFNVELGKMLNRSSEDGTGIVKPYVRAANVHWNGIELDNAGVNEMEFSSTQLERYRLHPGDLLVTEGGVTVGRSVIWSGELEECYYQNSLNRARVLPGSPFTAKYLYYWMYFTTASGYVDLVADKATFQHLTNKMLAAFPIVVPEASEQHAIAAFLDRETTRLDALIAKKERLLTLLAEKRAALINYAVTKGVEPSAPMRDSGTNSLDKIPEGWTGMLLKRWVKTPVTDGPHETPEFISDGVLFVSAEAVQNGRINFQAVRGCIDPETHSRYIQKVHPQRDDILLCKSGATTGKSAIVDTDEDFSIWSPLALIRANRQLILPEFLFLALQSDYIQDQIRQTWSAGTQPNIAMSEIERLFVVAPCIEKQQRIVALVRGEIERVAALSAKVRAASETLREYTAALISAAVTGKIDVRAVEQASTSEKA